MHELRERPAVRGGFVHIPYSTVEAIGTDRPYLRMAEITAGLTAVVQATLRNATDVKAGGGSLD